MTDIRLLFYIYKKYESKVQKSEHNDFINIYSSILPNQELSGAKCELQGKIVGVCSFYKRGG